MAGSYYNSYTFPKRCIDERLAKIIAENSPNEFYRSTYTTLDTFLRSISAGTDSLVSVSFDQTNGSVDELEYELRNYKIPFDRYCSDGDGHPPDTTYVRFDEDGKESEKTVMETVDGFEFIDVSSLRLAMAENDPIAAINGLLERYTSQSVTPLAAYTAETELGRDKQKMKQINEVLARLDNNELSAGDAMEEIRKIQEGAAV